MFSLKKGARRTKRGIGEKGVSFVRAHLSFFPKTSFKSSGETLCPGTKRSRGSCVHDSY
jgi:hypothetical protein